MATKLYICTLFGKIRNQTFADCTMKLYSVVFNHSALLQDLLFTMAALENLAVQ